MPTYKVTDPSTGKTVKLTGDSPPSEQELEDIFKTMGGGSSATLAPAAQDAPAEKPLSWASVPGQALVNTPRSAGEFAKNIGTAAVNVLNPNMEENTLMAVPRIAAGGIEKLIPGRQRSEDAWDALLGSYGNRYGGGENIKQALAHDPVGVAADVASLFGVAGAGAKAAGLAKTSNALSTVAKVANPMNAIGVPARAIGKAIPSSVPQKLYNSAAKFGTRLALKPSEIKQRVMTALDEGRLPTFKGHDELMASINSMNDQISNVIKNAAQQGGTVPISEIVKPLDKIRSRALNTFDPQPQIEILDRMEEALKKHPLAFNGELPVDVAQKMKQEAYRGLKNAYGTMKSIEIEGQKALALGVKDELVKKYPELKVLNKRDSRLIALEDSLARAAKRIDQHDVISLKESIAGTAAVASGKTGAIVNVAVQLLDKPQIKARLAVALAAAKKRQGFLSPKTPAKVPVLNALGRVEAENETRRPWWEKP